MSTIRRRVLVVEGETSIGNALHALLAGLDCESDIAMNGDQALAMISRESFDAILLDLRCSNLLPEEVVPQIHAIRPSLVGRVLVITGEVADGKTMDLIERYFLLQVPRSRLLQDLKGWLRALLGINPSPRHAD